MRVATGSTVLCLAALVLAVVASAASAAFPGRPGPIVYSKVDSREVAEGRVESIGGLYVHGPRVKQRPRPLTTDNDDHSPAVSADGRQVVFVNDDEGTRTSSIQVIGIDGSGRREVTTDGLGGAGPVFFPSGKAIAFVRRVDGHSHIFTVRLDGTGLRQLTRGPHDDYDPAVSPDGKRIAFVSDRDQDSRRDRSDLFAVGANGKGLRLLSDLPRSQAEPDWSPDGRRIAFAMRAGLGSNVFVVRTGGQRLRQLTGCPGFPTRCRSFHHPVFSPDGKHIVALSSGTRSSAIEVMRSDGRGASRTFDDAGTEEEGFGSRLGAPTWGPRAR